MVTSVILPSSGAWRTLRVGRAPIAARNPFSMNAKNPPLAADWTQLLADPDLVSHLGDLLRTYRDAPAEQREQKLIEAMRALKANHGKTSPNEPERPMPQSIPADPHSAPPFEPDIFTPSWGQDRRRYPRMKCFVAVELQVTGAPAPIWGNLSNASMGGCFVETVSAVPPGAKLAVGIWVATGKIWVKGIALHGIVTSSTPSFGVRLKFADMDDADRETFRQFLKFVEGNARSQASGQTYLASLKK